MDIINPDHSVKIQQNTGIHHDLDTCNITIISESERFEDLSIILQEVMHRTPEDVPHCTPMQRYEEVLLPTSMMPDPAGKLEFIKNLPYKDGDVLLTTYSKSGTTWMGNILGKMLKQNTDEVDRPVGRLLETASPEATLAMDTPRILLTHLWPKRLPTEFVEKKGKIILLLRNPKDVAVSYYFHLKQSALFLIQQTWDEFFLSYATGGVPYGQYLDYISEWDKFIQASKESKTGINVEVVFYEELKLNALGTLKRINDFLGCKKSVNELEEIYEACSLVKLKEKTNQAREKIPPGQRGVDGNSVMFRKGIIGDWKTYFKVAQNEMYNSLIESRMKSSTFSFKYPE